MKLFKGIIAAVLALTMLFSLTACHEQGEVAVTVGDVEITSGLYSYFLVAADAEAKQLIDEDENYDSTAEGFSYLKTNIEGVKFEEYVKNLALEKCIEYAAYENYYKEAGTTLPDDEMTSLNSMVDFYWNTYGFSAIYEANGVGFNTYLAATIHESKRSEYFQTLYGEGGEKALSADEIQKAVDDNYIAIYSLELDWSSDEDMTEAKAKAEMEKYKERLDKGEAFADIYEEYNKDDSTSSTTSSTTSSSSEAASSTDSSSSTSSGATSSEEEQTPAPKDELINIIGSEDTGYSFDYYDDVKAMKQDEVKVISDATNKVVYLVVKKDINSDTYYRDVQLTSDIISLLKEDEFEKDLDTYADTLEYDVNSFAINQFKVKNIYDGQ